MEGIPIEDWLRGFDEEIEELVAQPFGAALLHTVGACSGEILGRPAPRAPQGTGGVDLESSCRWTRRVRDAHL